MQVDDTKLLAFLDWIWRKRFSWTDNMSIEDCFDEVKKAFGEDIFVKVGLDKDTISCVQTDSDKEAKQ